MPSKEIITVSISAFSSVGNVTIQVTIGAAVYSTVINNGLSNQNNTTGIYYAGQLPPNNLLNPIAWSKFIQQWKDGYFKKKPLPVKD